MVDVFAAHKTKSEDKFSVWFYYLIHPKEELAKCKRCGAILKTKGGSTKGLLTHLKVHNIKLSRPAEVNNSVPNKLAKITSFLSEKEEHLFPAVLARLTAVDGLSFSVIVNSLELRKSLEARGFKVPKHADTVKQYVMEYYSFAKEKVVKDILYHKKNERKFSLSFDEWTSTSNKRYINLILQTNGKFWNLGLVRIKNTFNAECCVETIDKWLQDYGIRLSKDIVAITTDGASTMVKVGRSIVPDHQLCFAHGIQLGIIDVLYKKKNLDLILDAQEIDDEDLESLDASEADAVAQYYDQQYLDLTNSHNLQSIITKTRNIVKSFRKSPKRNEMLQKYVIDDHGSELKLILDCKTRWSSLNSMIERFILLEAPLKKVMVDLKDPFLEENELKTLKELTEVLKPVELAVKTLCRRDMNLCSAEAVIIFMLEEIKKLNSVVSYELYLALKKRTLERRIFFTTILNFLTKAALITSELNSESSISIIKIEIIRLLERLREDVSENDILLIESPVKENESIETRLEKTIENSKTVARTIELKSLQQIITQELDLFVNGGNRGVNLQLAFDFLMTVAPTSVECERCFSSSGLINNKIRSSLSDQTLNALIFLKSHLKEKKE